MKRILTIAILTVATSACAWTSQQFGWMELSAMKPASASVDTNIYTRLLMHCDGTNTSTTFTDSSVFGHVIESGGTVNDDLQLDTADKKIGTASMLFDGNGDYFQITNSVDWDVGTEDFTFECWVKRNDAAADYYALMCNGDGGSGTNICFYTRIDNASHLQSRLYWGATYTNILSTGLIVNASGWTHVALVRDGTNVAQYINGQPDGVGSIPPDTTLNRSPIPLGFGALWVNQIVYSALPSYFHGWVDEIRFSKGVARYTAPFTPSTNAFEAD